jgi:hypothetical protein
MRALDAARLVGAWRRRTNHMCNEDPKDSSQKHQAQQNGPSHELIGSPQSPDDHEGRIKTLPPRNPRQGGWQYDDERKDKRR